jgi:hypothetical protein
MSEIDKEIAASQGLARSTASQRARKMRKLTRSYLSVCLFASFWAVLLWAVFRPVSAAPAVSAPIIKPLTLHQDLRYPAVKSILAHRKEADNSRRCRPCPQCAATFTGPHFRHIRSCSTGYHSFLPFPSVHEAHWPAYCSAFSGIRGILDRQKRQRSRCHTSNRELFGTSYKRHIPRHP